MYLNNLWSTEEKENIVYIEDKYYETLSAFSECKKNY